MGLQGTLCVRMLSNLVTCGTNLSDVNHKGSMCQCVVQKWPTSWMTIPIWICANVLNLLAPVYCFLCTSLRSNFNLALIFFKVLWYIIKLKKGLKRVILQLLYLYYDFTNFIIQKFSFAIGVLYRYVKSVIKCRHFLKIYCFTIPIKTRQ